MSRPPPITTRHDILFPYSTLFLASVDEYRAGVGLDQQRVDAVGADAPGVLGDLPWFDRLAPALVDGVGLELGKDGFGGRRGGGEQQWAGECGQEQGGKAQCGHGRLAMAGGTVSVIDGRAARPEAPA